MTGTHHFLGAKTVVLLAALAAASCASYGPVYRSHPHIRSTDEYSKVQGYEDGRRRGETDFRRQRPYDPTRHGEFQNADRGYQGQHGSHYRHGFIAGYRDGYRGANAARGSARRPNGRSSQRPGRETDFSPAVEDGLRDGFERGASDARRGKKFDPVRAPDYRSGDRRYDRRYGSREAYKLEYRRAFREGYQRGFSGRQIYTRAR